VEGGICPYIQYNDKRFGLADRSAADLSQPRLRFKTTPVHLRFVVDKVTLSHLALTVLQFRSQHNSPILNTHSFIYHRRCIILATDSVIKEPIYVCRKTGAIW